MSGARHGCLLIADIGGYTRYLSEVELEHSTDILANLLQTLVRALEPNLRADPVPARAPADPQGVRELDAGARGAASPW
jgi:hypothetical protein